MCNTPKTIEQARVAIQAMLAKYPLLVTLIEQTTINDQPERYYPTRPCYQCHRGKLHYVGRNKFANGFGLGGLIVCDACGFHTTRHK